MTLRQTIEGDPRRRAPTGLLLRRGDGDVRPGLGRVVDLVAIASGFAGEVGPKGVVKPRRRRKNVAVARPGRWHPGRAELRFQDVLRRSVVGRREAQWNYLERLSSSRGAMQPWTP